MKKSAQEFDRELFEAVADVRHIAHADGGVAFRGTREGDHRGILVVVVVAAVPEAVAVGFRGLEAGAAEGLEFAVFVGHLGAADFDGQALADAGDDVVEQFGVGVDVFGDDVVEVVGGQVGHCVEIGIVAHLFNGAEGADFALPDERDGQHQQEEDQQQDFQEFLHIVKTFHFQ